MTRVDWDWGSGELLVDNSVVARRDHPVVKERWRRATEEGQLILVQPMLMEALYSAKNGGVAGRELEDLREPPTTSSSSTTRPGILPPTPRSSSPRSAWATSGASRSPIC